MSDGLLALGLDVGGTKIAAGLVHFPSARVQWRRQIPTRPERGGTVVLSDVVELSRGLLQEAGIPASALAGTGLGICELVSPSGEILSANCLTWKRDSVQTALGFLGPVVIEADVRAAARAEACFGAGRPFRSFLYVTIGTGIASCLVLDGQPYTGARGATGTMASSPLNVPCEHCGQTTRRTLEELAAGPALVARYNQRRPGGAESGHDVLSAAAAGDVDAQSVVRAAGQALQASVALLVNVLDPEAVILGGGLGVSQGSYWDEFLEATRRHIWSEVHRDLPILRAETGLDAGLIGAAYSSLNPNRRQFLVLDRRPGEFSGPPPPRD